jgi:hypothetical protein
VANEYSGYGRPPAHSRFKKGQSGNPQGRPKGTLNFVSVLQRTLRERVVINENGRRRTITKLEAAVKQLVNRSAGGDMNAFRMLFSLAQLAEEQLATDHVSTPVQFNEADQKVMLNFLKRFEQNQTKEKK